MALSKLLVMPGGCTSIRQPLDISINKPLIKSYIRQSWCQYIIEETDTGVSKSCPPQEAVIEWILRAQEKIEEKSMIIKKYF